MSGFAFDAKQSVVFVEHHVVGCVEIYSLSQHETHSGISHFGILVYAWFPMTAASHLELLREMFPEKFVLDIDEVAKVLGCSKQWIYVQSSRSALPFAKLPGSRIRVTVMELARYLDASGAQPDADKVVTPIERGTASSDEVQLAQEQPVAKKKIGRPRMIDGVLNNRGRS